MIQGIQLGPEVMPSHPQLLWDLTVSFWIGTIFLVVLDIPLIGVWVPMASNQSRPPDATEAVDQRGVAATRVRPHA